MAEHEQRSPCPERCPLGIPARQRAATTLRCIALRPSPIHARMRSTISRSRLPPPLSPSLSPLSLSLPSLSPLPLSPCATCPPTYLPTHPPTRHIRIHQGDVADSLYLVREGELIAYHASEGRERGIELGRMGAQFVFGESAIEANGADRRGATVVAAGPCTLLKLTRKDFKELFGDLSEVMRRNFNQKVLGNIAFFKELKEGEKSVLIESLVEESFDNATDIIRQGTQGDSFFIIKSGSVKVWKDVDGKKTIIKDSMGPSDYFGEMSLMNDEPRGRT